MTDQKLARVIPIGVMPPTEERVVMEVIAEGSSVDAGLAGRMLELLGQIGFTVTKVQQAPHRCSAIIEGPRAAGMEDITLTLRKIR